MEPLIGDVHVERGRPIFDALPAVRVDQRELGRHRRIQQVEAHNAKMRERAVRFGECDDGRAISRLNRFFGGPAPRRIEGRGVQRIRQEAREVEIALLSGRSMRHSGFSSVQVEPGTAVTRSTNKLGHAPAMSASDFETGLTPASSVVSDSFVR